MQTLCIDLFNNYIYNNKHYLKKHSKVTCDLCDLVCDDKQIKIHINTKHKKLTPSTAQLIPHTNKLESNFKCDKCRKKIMIKGILNHLRKVHIVQCIY